MIGIGLPRILHKRPPRLKGYAPYLTDLRRLVVHGHAEKGFAKLAERAVNGEASARLIELVSGYSLKRTGAFFTSSELSKRVASAVPVPRIGEGLTVDPACGAGNLLLAAARKLPMSPGLHATLTAWGQRLAGFDLHSRFIRATHLRLAVLALSRGAEFDLTGPLSLADYFPHIRRGDGLREIATLQNIEALIVNPPFASVLAPKSCSWAVGRVTKAAIFFDRCLQHLPAGAAISAVLPDVLRSGTRYQLWRRAMEQHAAITAIRPIGNFQTADVDVFLLEMRMHRGKPVRTRRGVWWTKSRAAATLGDQFSVHVGAVVPHRLLPDEGPVSPYLHAKDLPHWGVTSAGTESVAFAGRLFKPPFVAVRRTSNPTDKHRALGTLITGKVPVAVENHLLVCSPTKGGLAACRRLLESLRSAKTNQFLNRRIRCRHLTVGVVREIPC